MQVNKVTATVRYSQDTGKGAWKSLELGCEASINEREDWLIAQATLYGQLAQQFRELWARNGTAPETHQEGHQINGERSDRLSSPMIASIPLTTSAKSTVFPSWQGKARTGPPSIVTVKGMAGTTKNKRERMYSGNPI